MEIQNYKNSEKKPKTWLWIMIVIIITAIAIGGLMYWWQLKTIDETKNEAADEKNKAEDSLNSQINDLKKQMEDLQVELEDAKLEAAKSTTTTKTTTTTTVNDDDDARTEFQTAIDSNDQSAAQSMMAETVNVIEEATSCCGDMNTANAAEAATTYLSKGVPFNWSQNQQIVKSIKTNYPKYTSFTIGVGTDGSVFAYHENTSGKIDKIYMSVSNQLLDLE